MGTGLNIELKMCHPYIVGVNLLSVKDFSHTDESCFGIHHKDVKWSLVCSNALQGISDVKVVLKIRADLGERVKQFNDN